MNLKHTAIAVALLGATGLAQAADYHNIAVETCEARVQEQLGIDAADYSHRVDRMRGSQRNLEVRLKVADASTGDKFKATCKVNTVDRTVADLSFTGQNEGAREVVASIAQD